MFCFPTVVLFCLLGGVSDQSQDVRSARTEDRSPQELPLLFSTDFQSEATDELPDDFEFTDENAWKVEELDGEERVLSQFKKSEYAPPHRSPLSIGLVKDLEVGDFVLTAKVRSTIPDYGHRDACVFFGYQDQANFYYVHLGKRTDDHANQVFIVDDAPRTKISEKTTSGTPWDDAWHEIKITRDIASGSIAVYFDDMEEPVMTAKNSEFNHGQLGFGSFDDTTQWDDIRVYGTRHESPEKESSPRKPRNHATEKPPKELDGLE